MTRAEKIAKGKIWQINMDSTPDIIIFEGSHSACWEYLRINHLTSKYKRGTVRLAKLIWEK